MPSKGPRARTCGCCTTGAARVWVGDEHGGVRFRMCFACDAPMGSAGFPQGFDPPTWEINQRRRERGEFA